MHYELPVDRRGQQEGILSHLWIVSKLFAEFDRFVVLRSRLDLEKWQFMYYR
jgi:hypothetical protein